LVIAKPLSSKRNSGKIIALEVGELAYEYKNAKPMDDWGGAGSEGHL
jgi:hypothetical protein